MAGVTEPLRQPAAAEPSLDRPDFSLPPELLFADRWRAVDSSWLAAVCYQPPVLFIQRKDGAVMVCPEVSPELVAEFLAAPSLGKFFNRHLRRPARPRSRRRPRARSPASSVVFEF
jgi:hypothetical protein